MKILCVCNYGSNRSVHLASLLKKMGHDCLAAGVDKNALDTLNMLCNWAEVIIVTDVPHLEEIKKYCIDQTKIKLCNVGPDKYTRPMNQELKGQIQWWIEDNKSWLEKI